MLKNDYLLAKIGVDTAENELFKVIEHFLSLRRSSHSNHTIGDNQRVALEIVGAPLLVPKKVSSTVSRTLFSVRRSVLSS